MILLQRHVFRLFQIYGKNNIPLSKKKFLSCFDAKKYGDTHFKDFYIQEILFKSNDFWEVKK
jgi:hypothetical protein